MPRYISSRTGQIYSHHRRIRDEDEEIEEDPTETPRRRVDDGKVDALSMRVDLIAEVQEKQGQQLDYHGKLLAEHFAQDREHQAREKEWQDDIKADLGDLKGLVAVSKRAGRIVMVIVAALGALVTWVLSTWHQLQELGK